MSSDTIPSNVSHLSTYDRNAAGVRRETLHRSERPVRLAVDNERPAFGERKKFVAKGHDRLLENAQYGKNRVRLALMDGSNVYGKVVARDKFTITLQHEPSDREESGLAECFYKHSIQGVLVFPVGDSQE